VLNLLEKEFADIKPGYLK